jgi:hypothetical protein
MNEEPSLTNSHVLVEPTTVSVESYISTDPHTEYIDSDTIMNHEVCNETHTLAQYGEMSTRHLNCMSISNPFGDIMIGDVTIYGNIHMMSDINLSGSKFNLQETNFEMNNSSVNIIGSSFELDSTSSLNVNGYSSFNDVATNGKFVVNGNKFMYFGEDNTEESWRMGIVNGNMYIQKFEFGSWINKSVIQ